MVNTRHFSEDRQVRDKLIKEVIGDTNNVICVNVLDRGHRDGEERFELTDKAIIKVYNHRTNRHITDMVARPKQIYDRLRNAFNSLDQDTKDKILKLAREHQRLGYNQV